MNSTELPGDFLRRFPALETFHFAAGQIQMLVHLLAYTPRLTEVHLYVSHIPVLPGELFSHAPQLTKLNLELLGRPDVVYRVLEGFLGVSSEPERGDNTYRVSGDVAVHFHGTHSPAGST